MCSTGPTTSYGYELSPGDETDLDDIPVCCGSDMTGKKLDDGDIEHACENCGTVLEINENGLVWDIREKPAA